MPFIFLDSTFLLLVPAIILAIYAQMKVKSTYAKYSKVSSKRRLSGAEVAQEVMATHGVHGVPVERTPGKLTDHYDPRSKTLRLSNDIYRGTSIAALGIAAHEAGHAVQHGKNFGPLALRNAIYPAANIGTTLAFPLFFIGWFVGGSGMEFLMDLAILLYVGAVAFTVITLPVEFDASRRAMVMLRSGSYLDEKELQGARKVLTAAAMTYVAATAMAVLQLVRMLLIRGRN